MRTLPLLTLLAFLLFGCASAEKNAYRTIAVVSVSADKTMRGWGQYVQSGKASAGDEAKVKAAYQKYQAAMSIAEAAVLTAKDAPAGQETLETALQAVEAAAAELTRIILTFQSQ